MVRDHLERFLGEAESLRDGEGVPGFVEEEFRKLLRCGALAGGFARFRCSACGYDRLVPLSCRGRGFCQRGAAVAAWWSGPHTSLTTCFRGYPCDSGS